MSQNPDRHERAASSGLQRLDPAPLAVMADEVGVDAVAVLLDELEAELTSRAADAERDCTSRDWRAIEIRAHAIKSVARTFGLMALSAIAYQLEQAGVTRDTPDAALARLLEELPRSLAALADHRKQAGLIPQR